MGQVQDSERADLAEQYATYTHARFALGTVLMGILLLLPICGELIAIILGKHNSIGIWHWVQLKFIVIIPIIWILSRGLLSKLLYRKFGYAELVQKSATIRMNIIGVFVVLLVATINLVLYWSRFTQHAWPIPAGIDVLRHAILVIAWATQIIIIGIYCISGVRELLLFCFVGVIGGIQLSPVAANGFIHTLVVALLYISFALAPYFIYIGVVEHRKYNKTIKAIEDLKPVGL